MEVVKALKKTVLVTLIYRENRKLRQEAKHSRAHRCSIALDQQNRLYGTFTLLNLTADEDHLSNLFLNALIRRREVMFV